MKKKASIEDQLREQERERARRFACPDCKTGHGEPIAMDFVCPLRDCGEYTNSLYQCPVCKSIKEF